MDNDSDIDVFAADLYMHLVPIRLGLLHIPTKFPRQSDKVLYRDEIGKAVLITCYYYQEKLYKMFARDHHQFTKGGDAFLQYCTVTGFELFDEDHDDVFESLYLASVMILELVAFCHVQSFKIHFWYADFCWAELFKFHFSSMFYKKGGWKIFTRKAKDKAVHDSEKYKILEVPVQDRTALWLTRFDRRINDTSPLQSSIPPLKESNITKIGIDNKKNSKEYAEECMKKPEKEEEILELVKETRINDLDSSTMHVARSVMNKKIYPDKHSKKAKLGAIPGARINEPYPFQTSVPSSKECNITKTGINNEGNSEDYFEECKKEQEKEEQILELVNKTGINDLDSSTIHVDRSVMDREIYPGKHSKKAKLDVITGARINDPSPFQSSIPPLKESDITKSAIHNERNSEEYFEECMKEQEKEEEILELVNKTGINDLDSSTTQVASSMMDGDLYLDKHSKKGKLGAITGARINDPSPLQCSIPPSKENDTTKTSVHNERNSKEYFKECMKKQGEEILELVNKTGINDLDSSTMQVASSMMEGKLYLDKQSMERKLGAIPKTRIIKGRESKPDATHFSEAEFRESLPTFIKIIFSDHDVSGNQLCEILRYEENVKLMANNSRFKELVKMTIEDPEKRQPNEVLLRYAQKIIDSDDTGRNKTVDNVFPQTYFTFQNRSNEESYSNRKKYNRLKLPEGEVKSLHFPTSSETNEVSGMNLRKRQESRKLHRKAVKNTYMSLPKQPHSEVSRALHDLQILLNKQAEELLNTSGDSKIDYDYMSEDFEREWNRVMNKMECDGQNSQGYLKFERSMDIHDKFDKIEGVLKRSGENQEYSVLGKLYEDIEKNRNKERELITNTPLPQKTMPIYSHESDTYHSPTGIASSISVAKPKRNSQQRLTTPSKTRLAAQFKEGSENSLQPGARKILDLISNGSSTGDELYLISPVLSEEEYYTAASDKSTGNGNPKESPLPSSGARKNKAVCDRQKNKNKKRRRRRNRR